MYDKTAIAAQKKAFFTAFGRYMLPVPSAFGESVSWLNYRTGVKNLYFRIELTFDTCTVGLIVSGATAARREELFDRLLGCRSMFPDSAAESWNWQQLSTDDYDHPVAQIEAQLTPVHFMQPGDWPAIIAFLKQRLIQLDQFWFNVKALFLMHE